ncbi:MAG: polysaccharide biosynthesis tyrosine autokinase, partial [Acidimicrobiales bacterium]
SEDNGSVAAQRQALVNQQATFRERLDELRVDAALTTGGVSHVRAAEQPEDPVVPTPERTIALAAIVGLVLGIGAALLVDYLDESVVSADDVAAIGGPPVLSVVPVEAPPDERPLALSEPTSSAVESYRGLRTNLLFLGLDKPLRLVQLTSALPGEGKTTTAGNLAVVLAAAGKQVVLVDADLRKPRLHTMFGINPAPGLTEVILGHPMQDAIRKVGDGLYVLPAGSPPANPAEMLISQHVSAVLRTLAEQYEHVVVDSSPVLPVADAVGIAAAADGVLLVAQAKRVSRRALVDALARMNQVGAQVFGVVLNRAPRGRAGYGRGYGYGYGYDYGHGTPAPYSFETLRAVAERRTERSKPSVDEREPLAGHQ